MTLITAASEAPDSFRHRLQIGKHALHTDLPVTAGGEDAAPDPHDYFDAALAACKALTLKLYAQRKGIPLSGLEVEVQRDASQEQKGQYGIQVRLHLEGDLSDAQRQELHRVADRCPVHKLMTSATITIDTQLG